MKVIYACENCGKKYASEAEAAACEDKHEKDAQQKELEKQREAKLLNTINTAVNLYVSKHHKLPEITLTPENETIIFGSFDKIISNFINPF